MKGDPKVIDLLNEILTAELTGITQRVERDFREGRRLLSFRGYLELFASNPLRHSRDACRYLRDMFDYSGRSELSRPWGEESRFKLFDLPFLDRGEAAREALVGHVKKFLSIAGDGTTEIIEVMDHPPEA